MRYAKDGQNVFNIGKVWNPVCCHGNKTVTRGASRGHKAAPSEQLLSVLSDRAQTSHNDRTFHSKKSYDFCFLMLTVFGGKMTSALKANFHFLLIAQKMGDFERTH